MAESGGLLNRTGSQQPVTKQAKTRDFLSISLNLNSVLRLPVCREASRSLHNLLHRPEELRYGSRDVRTGEQRGRVLLEASRGARRAASSPVVLADAACVPALSLFFGVIHQLSCLKRMAEHRRADRVGNRRGRFDRGRRRSWSRRRACVGPAACRRVETIPNRVREFITRYLTSQLLPVLAAACGDRSAPSVTERVATD